VAPELLLVLTALTGGYTARRLGRFPASASETLNRFVIDVCLPATILRVLPGLRMRWDLLLLVVTPWALLLIAYAASSGLARLLRLGAGARAVLFLCTGLGNTSFLGFPLISALLGERAVSLAVVYDQLGSFLILCSVAPLALARATGATRQRFSDTVRNVLAFPPFIALILGLLPLPWKQPLLYALLTLLSQALIPVAMFAVGLRLRLTPPTERAAFASGLLLKLVVFPGLALLLALGMRAPADLRAVAVLESAMPAMITAGALAMASNVAPELAASLVGWGVVLAQLSVPAWAALLRELPR
jgi:predicted permease